MSFIHLHLFIVIVTVCLCFVDAAHINPWDAYRNHPDFSIQLGYEISVMTASDGRFIYGRGCCYGMEYELQVWGAGQDGSELGADYGTINAPTMSELDNGKESVLLYLPKHNKLVYWRWGSSVMYVARGRPEPSDHMRLHWLPVYTERYGLPLERASIANDASNLYILDYQQRQIIVVDGETFKTLRRIRLAASTHILAPGPNEDNHSFAFDGEYFYFGADHSGNCYGIYTPAGEYAGVQCSQLGGSMLSYSWALGQYVACGTDQHAPVAAEAAYGSSIGPVRVFNEKYGNGAHCSFWAGYHKYEAAHAVCMQPMPVLAPVYTDLEGGQWHATQKDCEIRVSRGYLVIEARLAPSGRAVWKAPAKVLVSNREDPAFPGFDTELVIDQGKLQLQTGLVLDPVDPARGDGQGLGHSDGQGRDVRGWDIQRELRDRLRAYTPSR